MKDVDDDLPPELLEVEEARVMAAAPVKHSRKRTPHV